MENMEKHRPPPYNHEMENPMYNTQPPPGHMGGPSYSQPPTNNPQYGYPPYHQQQQQQQPVIQPVFIQPPLQQTQMPASTTVHINTGAGLGGCPVCHNNSWTGTYPCCAWFLCIVCFPIGIICCCCMRQKKCTQCGYTIG